MIPKEVIELEEDKKREHERRFILTICSRFGKLAVKNERDWKSHSSLVKPLVRMGELSFNLP
tara:strand:- start:996 stop:1181 length:186 start_codon:yes stop_codon:yes gene_type:complete